MKLLQGVALCGGMAVGGGLGAVACSVDVAGVLGATSNMPEASTRRDGGDAMPSDARPDAVAHGDAGDSATDARVHETGPEMCPATPNCSNSACQAQGYRCVGNPGSPWAVVAAELGASTACPVGYDSGVPLLTVLDGGAPAVCGCSCGLAGHPSCASTGEIHTYYATGCAAISMISLGDGGACTNQPGDSLATYAAGLKLASEPAVTGNCTGQVTTVLPDAATSVAICTPSQVLLSTGCPSGQVCSATIPSRHRCVLASSANQCPSSYPNALPVGSSLDDSRGCGSCTCGAPTGSCGNPTLEFYAQPGCSGPSVAVPLSTSQCTVTMAPEAGAFQYYTFNADASATCGPPSLAPVASGSVAVGSPGTLCCEDAL